MNAARWTALALLGALVGLGFLTVGAAPVFADGPDIGSPPVPPGAIAVQASSLSAPASRSPAASAAPSSGGASPPAAVDSPLATAAMPAPAPAAAIDLRPPPTPPR